ncbi:MAG TPA: hypothetical protein PKC67_00300 [Kiritimatiellia bacterium]|nr:hypothetical protein [Kiritimatiellia bacterium]HMP32761.1 hypothetical protein [Kiritimatiellia bacterium]
MMPPYLARLIATLALAAMTGRDAPAAILQIEDFSADPVVGWSSRDGEMTVGTNSSSLLGTFAAQDTPFFESDAFRIDAAPWIGNYNTIYPGFASFSLDFLAATVLPSTMIIRIGNGSTTFIRNLLPQIASVGAWIPGVAVPLAYDASWLGGDASQFNAVMADVNFIDIQIGRNGTAEQQFRIDNFSLLDDPIDNGGGGGGGPSAVPEPNVLSFIAAGVAMLYAVRRRLVRSVSLART